MSDTLFAAMLSAFSYVDVIEGQDAKDMKDLYHAKYPTAGIMSWGDQQFTDAYLANVTVERVYHENSSLDAYILADQNTKELHVVFRGTQELLPDLIEGALLSLNYMGDQERFVPNIFVDAVLLLEEFKLSDPE